MNVPKNELSCETSPYLLQHAHNPVHWKAWSKEILDHAQKENKLILISIGYSACHWCHVMEKESFEDDNVATLMNKYFINIKVDREERPDVDAIYMKAIQIMTGRGGWPLNAVCLPDGRPVWGGTYFDKIQWTDTLRELSNLYQSQPEKMEEYASKLHEGIHTMGLPGHEKSDVFDVEKLHQAVKKWKKNFDIEMGGTARAPKFMMPSNYDFLLRYGWTYDEKDILKHVERTLTRMAWGGIFDVIEGGFSRYSVDMHWHIPHFEKMLYDNALLISLYSKAYRYFKNPLYKEVVEKSISFVEKEWRQPSGAFFSATDADSLTSSEVKKEGAYYVWTIKELETLITNRFDIFKVLFNINSFGYWENGDYVLIQTQPLSKIASRFDLPESEIITLKKDWEKKLSNYRKSRYKPDIDSKILTSWNALMISAYTEAYVSFENPSYLEKALQTASFLEQTLWNPKGYLKHILTGKREIKGFLDDYAFTTGAFLDLYKVTLNESWCHKAKQLSDYCMDHFYDQNTMLFRFSEDSELIATHYEWEDNVIPSSNAVMAQNLYQLSILFENPFYKKICYSAAVTVLNHLDYPSAFSKWLDLYLSLSTEQKELAVTGVEALPTVLWIQKKYLPNLFLTGSPSNTNIPYLKNKRYDQSATFYLCENQTCQPPTTQWELLSLSKE